MRVSAEASIIKALSRQMEQIIGRKIHTINQDHGGMVGYAGYNHYRQKCHMRTSLITTKPNL